MLGTARGTAVAVLAGALAAGAVVVGPAGAASAAPGTASGRSDAALSRSADRAQRGDALRWSVALAGGDAVGVEVVGGTARLVADRTRAFDAALSPDGHGDSRSPGLLTLPARRLDAPVDRVDAQLDLAGSADAVAVDVRGLRPGGRWSEWLPAEPAGAPGTAGGTLRVVLPDPATQVQARLVLDPVPVGGQAPEVRGLTLSATAAPPSMRAQARRTPESYLIFATREGLVGGTTANGHRVKDRDMFAALPSRRALSPRDTSDYSVKVCAPNGRCAYAPVWDVGPWNTRDDYWNPSNHRQSWRDLPRGVPQAQAARSHGHNKGRDQFGRVVKNPAGIDLADGLFWDALRLRDNSWVTVDYLWTGDSPLATVRVDRRVDLRSAPNPGARVVGLVADRAAVPVQCRTGSWLRIGTGQFLPSTSVPRAQWPNPLPTCR